MRSFFVFLAAFFIILSTGAARAEVVDRIIAVVNDSVITLTELNAATVALIDRLKEGGKSEGLDESATRKKVLDSLIEQKLIKQAADRAGIDVSEKEIDNAVDDVKRQNRMSHEGLLVALAESGLTYREYREQLKEQIREVKFMNKEFRSKVVVQQEEMENYYRQNIKEFEGPALYRFRVIFIAKGPAFEQKAGFVKEGLEKKERFEDMAREYSDAPSASMGGDLGFISETELSDELKSAAPGMAPGEISGMISAADGAYFIELVEKTPGSPRPIEEVRQIIHERLFRKSMDNRFAFWLGEFKKTAHIEVRF